MDARGILTLYDILFSCRCSSVVEHRSCKARAVSSNLTTGSTLEENHILGTAIKSRAVFPLNLAMRLTIS
jgi:hypothetical protein